ncbi:sugar transferase [uncultured Jannaschia sp.]|uniref:sugar transferase n=1 Tax=uncultured Jannaschia sp. TaxID=293347 RepID=UPI0026131B48|nr:sugar transferase [uncultured Jannaschia sp.]
MSDRNSYIDHDLYPVAVTDRPRHRFLKFASNDPIPVGGWFKRGFDVVAVSALMVFIAPLLLGLVGLISATSRGGAFYGHWRIGYGNRPFRCFKLRTMVVNGDEVLARHLLQNPDARREWEETQKLRDDPRVTPVGAVLRKLSLDELPQLLNVLLGDMSLVGPRPVPEAELRRYGRSSRYYLRARPGITGLWQISGRSTTSYNRRIAYDRLYVSRFRPEADLMILALTVPAAIRVSETS